jgi:pimeloyl-ACP methyl ester carboxylesterase
MPAVFVHGVPDTQRVWQPVIEQLQRSDVVCLSLPGFGNRRPADFQPDKDSYVAWLIATLSGLPRPIDLVGHDWGSLLVTRAVSLEPDLVRSWCGGGAPLDPDYVWHDTARIWQTPGKGEELMTFIGGERSIAGLVAQGFTPQRAHDTAAAIDEEMKACILGLYRSAVRVADDWFVDLARIQAPGLILWGERDPFAAAHFGQRLAHNTRGRLVELPQCGHWYQVEQPAAVARELEAFWRDLPS